MSEQLSSDSRLTPEVKSIIREFVWKTLAIPGAIAVILSAVAGYGYNSLMESQKASAYADATTTAYRELFAGAKFLENLEKENDKRKNELADLLQKSQSLKSKLDESVNFISSQQSIDKIKVAIVDDTSFIADLTKGAGDEISKLKQTLEQFGTKPAFVRGATGSGNTPPNISYNSMQCPDGEYLAGIKGWGAHGGVRYCVGCFVAVEIICRQF